MLLGGSRATIVLAMVATFLCWMVLGVVHMIEPAVGAENLPRWVPSTSEEGPPGRFHIGYTFGTHKGTADRVEGEVRARLAERSLDVDPGSLFVRIDDLRTGDETMECHLRQSLGLDYRKSDFPDSHVCVNDELPKSGPNAVVYPKVTFSWGRHRGLPIRDTVFTLPIEVEMHGVKKGPYPVDFSLYPQDSKGLIVKVDGQLELKLSDFGVVVKKALGVISVKDTFRIFLLPVLTRN